MRIITTKTKQILADTYTPVSVYLKIRDVFPKSILLESTDFHHLENCYSFICMKPIAEFKVENNNIHTQIGESSESLSLEQGTLVTELQNFIDHFQSTESNLPFNGFFGYTSYDAVQHFETIQLKNKEEKSEIPDLIYNLYKYVIAFNHLKDEILIIENILENDTSDLERVEQLIRNAQISNYPFQLIGEEESNLIDSEYINNVEKAKEHCKRGDVFQLVLSRKFKQAFLGDDFNVYRQLRSLNPSPYLFYFDYGSFKLFGSSPESQIEIKNSKAYINPIAGTYPRTGNDEYDQEQAELLSKDRKENAEHVMLVDLARNDLSRNCTDVGVETFKEIHFYSHVIHIVSKVSGRLKNSNEAIKLLADTFPAGTLTGAPKYKAMELIDKYENSPRGFYGGGIGFIGFNGNVNHAITIRTFMSKDNVLHYQAGAGIVSKSNAEKELQEVNHKLGALKQAIQKAYLYNEEIKINKN